MADPFVLDGKALSNQVKSSLMPRVERIKKEAGGITPVLATILVGSDPASETYVRMKGNACKKVGLESRKIQLSEETTTQELIERIDSLNRDDSVSGILLQHPVPSGIDERACFDRINLEKDVDGVTSLGFGKMAMGEDVYGSATPAGIMRILDHYGIETEGKRAVVVGRSPILGKPVAMMLLNRNATVTVCHSRTGNLEEIVGEADIVVGAVGRPRFIKGNWIKSGAVLIDAGYHPEERCGDIDLKSASERSSAYTPVPGGVGPMTIATLLAQTVEAAEKRLL
ncbi:MAG: tetrahydrofolate dehydrogenase/cyclohydrolase catalytic domain-containing protein [Chitinivibrionales bacterium]